MLAAGSVRGRRNLICVKKIAASAPILLAAPPAGYLPVGSDR